MKKHQINPSLAAKASFALAASVAFLITSSPLRAADNNWDNESGDFLWTTGTNWSDNAVPDATDTVRINSPAVDSTNAVIFNTTGTIAKLRLGDNGGGSAGYLKIEGGTLTIDTNDNSRLGANGTGTVDQSGGTVNFRNLTVANDGGSAGTYNLTGGNANFSSTLFMAYDGVGVFNVSGSGTLATAQEFNISGNNGTGTLNILAGGTVNAQNRIAVGGRDNGGGGSYNLGRNGTIALSGGTLGTTLANGGAFITLGSQSGNTAQITGYGTVDTYSGVGGAPTLYMSAFSKIIADSDGVNGRVLDFSDGQYSVANTTTNASTSANTFAGFYAQDKGNLLLKSQTKGAGAANVNFGGPNTADALNLVNSATLVLSGGSSAGDLDISLLASDNTDFAPTGDLTGAVGIWDLDFTGSVLDMTSLTVHYDSVLAGGTASSLNFFYSTGGSWTEIDATIDTTLHTATITGSFAEGTYALALSAVPEPSTGILLAAGVTALLLRRRRTNA